MLKLLVYLVLLMMIKQNAAQKVYTVGTAVVGTPPTTAVGFNALCTSGKFPGVIGSDADVTLLKTTYVTLCGTVSASTASSYAGCALAIAPAPVFALGPWIVDYYPAATYLQTTMAYLLTTDTASNKAASNAVAIASAQCLVVGADSYGIYITAVSDCTGVPLLCQNYDESSTTTSTTTTTTTTTTTKNTGAINFIIGLFDYILRWVLSDNGME